MSSTLGLEQRSLGYSVLLHLGLILIAAVGLPMLMPDAPPPEPLVMTVDILPIGAITNVKPSDQPIQKAQQAPAKTAQKEMPKPVATPPQPQPQASESEFNPMADKPKDDKKEADKPKTEEAKQPPKDDQKFADLLKNLAKESAKKTDKTAKDKTTTPENLTRSDAPYDASAPLSISEKDAIRNQFIKCWRMPAGAKDPHSLAVRLRVLLKEDGSVISVDLMPGQESRYSSEPFFRAAADSAKRAVAECSPLKDLPPDKYGSWHDMDLNFDPSELLY